VDEYLCVTVVSKPNEGQSDFSARLSRFWTHMLRTHPDGFEKVYAETVKFETADGRLSRQYLVEAGVADLLEREFSAAGLDSKYEAVPPAWMWIEH
jgi:hypothetical protein